MELLELAKDITTREYIRRACKPVYEVPYVKYDIEGKEYISNNFKSIVNNDNKLLAVHTKDYTLVSNQEVLEPFLQRIDSISNKWFIDPAHTFVTDKRMRLHIVFPDLAVSDGDSDIALTTYIDNSYDGSTGVRFTIGGLRRVCSNGMILESTISKFYSKHNRKNILSFLDTFIQQLISPDSIIKSISERVRILRNIDLNVQYAENQIEEYFDESITKLAKELIVGTATHIINAYTLWNILTYIISHNVALSRRYSYQLKLEVFYKHITTE